MRKAKACKVENEKKDEWTISPLLQDYHIQKESVGQHFSGGLDPSPEGKRSIHHLHRHRGIDESIAAPCGVIVRALSTDRSGVRRATGGRTSGDGLQK